MNRPKTSRRAAADPPRPRPRTLHTDELVAVVGGNETVLPRGGGFYQVREQGG